MTGTLPPEWLLSFSRVAMIAGMSLLAQSTVLIAAGLALAYALRRKGAAMQSLVLRAFLVAVFLCLPVFMLMDTAGLNGIRLELPRMFAGKPLFVIDPPGIDGGVHPNEMRPSNAAEKMIKLSVDKEGTHETISRKSPMDEMAPRRKNLSVPTHMPIALPESGHPFNTVSPARSLQHFPKINFAMLCTALWAMCSLVLLSRLAVYHRYILRVRRSAVEAKPSSREACRKISRLLGVRPPRTLQSPKVKSPFLAGIFPPCIFLPLGGQEAALDEHAIFIHELAHLKRRDPLWNLFRQLGVALFPFQPLMWALSHWIEETSDYAADDYVAKLTGKRTIYAGTLIAIARSYRPSRHETAAGVGIVSFKSSLQRRVVRILDVSRVITLHVSARALIAVSSLCLCTALLSGLFGFRETSYAQVKKASEIMQKGRMLAALAGIAAVMNQAKQPFQDAPPTEKTAERPPESEPEKSLVTPIQSDIVSNAPADALIPGETETDFIETPVESAAAHPVSEETSFHDEKNEVHISGINGDTAAPPAEMTAVRPTSADSLFRAEIRGFSATTIDKGNAVAAHPGPLEITVPENYPDALRENLTQGQENPVWSPTGKIIAFTGSNGIGVWAVSVKGGDPLLVYDNRDDSISGGSARTLSFTPDGKGLTIQSFKTKNFADGVAKETVTDESSSIPIIETIDLETGERRMIAENARGGSWSPDGRYFVYTDSGYYGVSVLDTHTREIRRVSDSGTSPAITPDGASIIYVDWRGGETDQLFRAPLAGGKPEQLTAGGFWWSPKCSPDGEWILCSGLGEFTQESYTRLRAFNLISRRAYDIFIPADKNTSAEIGAWSPSGRQFCYTLTSGKFVNGKNIRKSTIHIDDFHLPSLARPEATPAAQPVEFKLIGNYPNPFNPSTVIRFSLPSNGFAGLDIFSMNGQKIRSLAGNFLPAGTHSILWDGRDQHGNPVSSGVYISRLMMEGKVETRRMTLVK